MKINLNGAITCVATWHEQKDDVRDELGSKNPQKWVPGPNIPGTAPVRYQYLRVKTGTENVKSWYQIGMKMYPVW
ncbi:hypothetical protein HanIR_Chr16g0808761 [Helianthus annuus]|nr:hypothetical protein HanIR_Chr16g0808761 [Helianthus annuus]